MNSIRLTLIGATFLLNSVNAPADTLYVWSGDGTIQKFATNGVGTLVTTNLSGWNGPVGLVLDNVGNLYAGVPSESHIWKFLPDGSHSLIGSIDSVSGLTFDRAGNLYATIPNYNEILKLDYGQDYGYYFGVSTNYSQSALAYPINLAFNNSDNIYVGNGVSPFFNPSPYTNTIEEFSSNFTDLGAFSTGLNQPWGLAFDTGGNLYVAHAGTSGILKNTIVKFNTNGVRSTFANASKGLSSPQGLAFDSAGNLYVANSGNGTIQKFTPTGTGSVFASGMNSPSSIAIFPGLNLWSTAAIKLCNPKLLPGGVFQFGFTDNAGLAFTVLGTTNPSLSLSDWATIGSATEVAPGQYQFTDAQATNHSHRFYRVRSP